jgi:hypothetical protein
LFPVHDDNLSTHSSAALSRLSSVPLLLCVLCAKFFLWQSAEDRLMSEPSYEELKAQLAELQKQTGAKRSGALDFRVGEKGGVSVYGLGRFPVTLYYEQWIRLLGAAPELKSFLEEQKSAGKLKLKE